MMDRDSITRTGARAPGVEQPASLERRCITESSSLTVIGACGRATGCTKDGGKPCGGKGMPGAGLTEPPYGKAPSERPALKPYWGKPAVRNLGGTMETSASCEARSAPSFYPANLLVQI